MKTLSPVITESHSQEQIVEAINSANQGHAVEYFGGSDMHTGDQLAGQYAYDAAHDQNDVSVENIGAHLEIISEAGAQFDAAAAMREAMRFVG